MRMSHRCILPYEASCQYGTKKIPQITFFTRNLRVFFFMQFPQYNTVPGRAKVHGTCRLCPQANRRGCLAG